MSVASELTKVNQASQISFIIKYYVLFCVLFGYQHTISDLLKIQLLLNVFCRWSSFGSGTINLLLILLLRIAFINAIISFFFLGGGSLCLQVPKEKHIPQEIKSKR